MFADTLELDNVSTRLSYALNVYTFWPCCSDGFACRCHSSCRKVNHMGKHNLLNNNVCLVLSITWGIMYNCTMFIRVDNYSHYYNLKQHIQNNFNSLFPDKMRSNSYCILLIALFEITSTLSEPRSSQSRSLIPNSRRSRQSTSSTPDPPDPAAASEETERSQLQNGQEDLSVSESQLNPVSLINIKKWPTH